MKPKNDMPAAEEPQPQGAAAPESPVEAAEKKAREASEQLMRVRADFENAKKRLEKDKADAVKFANEKLLIEILSVLDTFDRAMTSLAEGHDAAKVQQGLKIAQDQLHRVLERHGVQPVKAAGSAFDPNVHEAVAMVRTNDAENGSIVDELQKGYTLNGRLIRPSRVRVAQKIQDNEQSNLGGNEHGK